MREFIYRDLCVCTYIQRIFQESTFTLKVVWLTNNGIQINSKWWEVINLDHVFLPFSNIFGLKHNVKQKLKNKHISIKQNFA